MPDGAGQPVPCQAFRHLLKFGAPARSNDRSASLNELDQQNDERYHQQDMDKPRQGVGTNHSYQPQDEKNDKYCPKHTFLLSIPSQNQSRSAAL
jgi:hypothetical protein